MVLLNKGLRTELNLSSDGESAMPPVSRDDSHPSVRRPDSQPFPLNPCLAAGRGAEDPDHVLYFVRPSVGNMKLIANQIRQRQQRR